MIVRRALPEDAEAIRQVHIDSIRQICGPNYTERQIDAWSRPRPLSHYTEAVREHIVFVAEDRDAIVGFAHLDCDNREIKAVYVAPSKTRLGVGTRLLAALEDSARELGLTQLSLASSITAVPFYDAMGFESLGNDMHRLRDGTEIECVRMTKSL